MSPESEFWEVDLAEEVRGGHARLSVGRRFMDSWAMFEWNMWPTTWGHDELCPENAEQIRELMADGRYLWDWRLGYMRLRPSSEGLRGEAQESVREAREAHAEAVAAAVDQSRDFGPGAEAYVPNRTGRFALCRQAIGGRWIPVVDPETNQPSFSWTYQWRAEEGAKEQEALRGGKWGVVDRVLREVVWPREAEGSKY